MYKIRRPPGQNFFCSLSQSCFRRGVIRILGSSFRRLRYILYNGIKVNFVNFSRLCCTSFIAYKVEFDWFLQLLGDIK